MIGKNNYLVSHSTAENFLGHGFTKEPLYGVPTESVIYFTVLYFLMRRSNPKQKNSYKTVIKCLWLLLIVNRSVHLQSPLQEKNMKKKGKKGKKKGKKIPKLSPEEVKQKLVSALMAKCEMTEDQVLREYDEFYEKNKKGVIGKEEFLNSRKVHNIIIITS